MARKPRSDSTTAAINAMVNASRPLPTCPKHVRLNPEHMPFWNDLLRARSRDEWTETDLVIAAQLARVQYDIEREALLLEQETSVLTNERGTPVANPRVTVLERYAARQMALLRALMLSGVAAKGQTRDVLKSRAVQRQAENARESLADDELLAS